MAHSLPERIRYLEPVRKQLAALDPEEIHEDTDLSVLRKVVRKRIKGLSDEIARVLLADDAAELNRWLCASCQADQRLYFILPILSDAIEILLTEQPKSPPERGEANMEVPEGAKVMIENGCWDVKWGRVCLSLYPSHREDMHREIGRFKYEAKIQSQVEGSETSIVEVQFGEVSGIKCISRIKSPLFKRVDYGLDVPGGHIVAVLNTGRGDFDESKVERYFHTLRILNYPVPSEQEAPLG